MSGPPPLDPMSSEGSPPGPEPGPAPGGSGDQGYGAAAVAAGILRARRDDELAAEGWVRRFVGGPPKLTEQVELYEALGKEVLLDPVGEAELAEICAGCALALTFFKVVYTRSVK